jgi:hypothetical protein
VTEEIKRVVGKRWMPGCYVGVREMEGDQPRICIALTDDECTRICNAIAERAGTLRETYNDQALVEMQTRNGKMSVWVKLAECTPL